MQSCFVAKDYETPEDFKPDEKLFRTDEIQQDSTSIVDFSWKEVFTDSILQNHIETALENNLDIRIALQQIAIANSYSKEGKAGYFPSLELGGGVNYQNLAPNSQFGDFFNSITQYESSVTLAWEADVWGKIRSNRRATQAEFFQSIAGHQAVKTRLVADVASTYFELLSLDERISITEETIATREKSLATTEALKEAGQLTAVAVKQTEAQLYTAKAILIDLKNELRIAENTLSILKGEEPKSQKRSSLQQQDINQEMKTGVPLNLLSNRPDVLQAEASFRNAFELTNVARTNFYPSFNLTSNVGLQSLSWSDFFSLNSVFSNVLGNFTQPLFNRRAIKTQLEVSEAQQEIAALQFQQTLLTAGREVSDALYSYEMLSEKVEIKEKEFQAYEKAFDYSEELLKKGLANYLEVLTAQENVLNTELDLVNNQQALLQSSIDLYRALGGGWR
ncbi:multidrug transporter [Psychroflexus planctonicus]|uniref:Multidrug transporter n=2 Tax=Psychroflexus planctonicus TaxID=1526575 RepID=A0ABQ1SF45_9FLAO|nr:multidrug transporter [Psychroflexus planctonicus]